MLNKEQLQELFSDARSKEVTAVNEDTETAVVSITISKGDGENEITDTFDKEIPATLEKLEDEYDEQFIIKAVADKILSQYRDYCYNNKLITEEEKEEMKQKTVSEIEKLKEKADALDIDLEELL